MANEKPKLDNARKLRGIDFIDPDDSEHKETKNAMKKLEGPLEARSPCKKKHRSTGIFQETEAENDEFNTKNKACVHCASS